MLIPVEFHQITIDNGGDSRWVRLLYKQAMPIIPTRGTTVLLNELERGPKEFLVNKVKLTVDTVNGTTARVELLDPAETSTFRTF